MDWLQSSWYSLIPQPWIHVVLGALSFLVGALVGFERERKDKPAGFRTMQLIAFGACVFTQVSLHLGRGDPGRIAAQIVSGVGFLGAGVILHQTHGVVVGVTTAATIWAVAALGMVVGAGYPPAALAGSGLIYLVLTFGRWFEARALGPCRWVPTRVTFEVAGGKARVLIEDVLDGNHVPAAGRVWRPGADGLEVLEVHVCHAHHGHREVLVRLVELSQVVRIERE